MVTGSTGSFLLGLGALHHRLGHHAEAARRLLERARELDPGADLPADLDRRAATAGPRELVELAREVAGRRARKDKDYGHGDRRMNPTAETAAAAPSTERLIAAVQELAAALEGTVLGQRDAIDTLLVGLHGRRARPARRGAGSRQDPARPRLRLRIGRAFQPGAVHPRPDAGRHPRHQHLRGRRRLLPPAARAGVHRRPDGRRDQPHAAQDPGGPARGDAGAAGDDRRRAAPPAAPTSSSSPPRTRSSSRGPIPLPEAQLDRFLVQDRDGPAFP